MNLNSDNVFTAIACSQITGFVTIGPRDYVGDTLEVPLSTMLVFPNNNNFYTFRITSFSLPYLTVNILSNNILECSDRVAGINETSTNFFIDNSTQICGNEVIPESIINIRIIVKPNASSDILRPGTIYYVRIGKKVSDNTIIFTTTNTRTKRPLVSNNLDTNTNFIISKCSTIYPNINTARITNDNYTGNTLEIGVRPFIIVTYNPDTQNYEVQMEDASFIIRRDSTPEGVSQTRYLIDYQNSGTIVSVSVDSVTPTEICGQITNPTLNNSPRTLKVIITSSTKVLKTNDIYTIQIGTRASDGQIIASSQISRTKRPEITN